MTTAAPKTIPADPAINRVAVRIFKLGRVNGRPVQIIQARGQYQAFNWQGQIAVFGPDEYAAAAEWAKRQLSAGE